MIKKLVTILFTIFSTTFVASGQTLSDIQQLELEDGLLDRIVNKVHRDTFGYFYLFFDQGIQRYDGKNFERINSVQLNNVDLSQVTNLTQSSTGGITFYIEQVQFDIPAGSINIEKNTTQPTRNPAPPPNLNSFNLADQKYLIKDGTIWTEQEKVLRNISVDINRNLKCHLIKQDKEGNRIVLFGNRPRTTERILIIRTDGSVQDYSSLLNYNDNIKDIYCDDVDSKWLVATFNGINIFNFAQKGIENFHVQKGLKKSQFGNIITSVNSETDQILFLKETFGLRKINNKGEVELLYKDRPDLFHTNQKMIYDKLNDQFYSYSYNPDGEYELYSFQPKEDKVDVTNIPFSIRDFYNLDQDHLLIVANDLRSEKENDTGHILKYNKKNKSLIKIHSNIPSTYCINYINSTKEYWIGTQYGIYIYDQQFIFKEALTHDVNTGEKYLSHPEIRTLFEYYEYIIAGSYKGGIYIVDKTSKKIVKTISETNGLSDNAIASITNDNEDNIWIATFNGLTVLNDQLKIIKRFYEYDGLPNREFNSKAITKDKEGNIYFGTLNGIVKINPSQLLKITDTHGLHLNSLEVFKNKNVQKFNDLSIPLDLYTNYDSLKLSITYPDYFKYRFDDWSSSIDYNKFLQENSKFNKNGITISDLNKGNYNFTFACANEFTSSLSLNLSRDNRKLFNTIGLFMFLGLLGYLFTNYRIKQLRKFEEEKTKINTKIAELELTALRSQMNPHFIFNALGSVQYFIQTQNTEKADSYLSNFAKLMRKILESSKSKFISINEEAELLELYIGLEKMRFEKLFEFELTMDPELDSELPIPPMIIQPFVENAINHGLYHLKDRPGKLSLHFQYIDELHMRCIISDNGIGRTAANKLNKPSHISRGLEIVKDRIKTINSQSNIKVNITTIDLRQNQEATGTEITLNFEYED